MLEANLSEAEIKAVYTKMAPIYDVWAHLTEARARAKAFELSGIHDGIKILEVAVGTGLLFEDIVRENPNGENIGIELTEAMLRKAVTRLSATPETRYRLQAGNALSLEFEDDRFDLIFNCYMLDLLSFKDIDGALKEFCRVLRKGGKLVLVNMTEGRSAISRIYQTLYKISPRLMGGCRGLQTKKMVEASGFRVDHDEYIVQMSFPSEVIVASKI